MSKTETLYLLSEWVTYTQIKVFVAYHKAAKGECFVLKNKLFMLISESSVIMEETWLSVLGLLVLMTCGTTGLDQAMKDHVLKLHNDFRAKQGASNMPKLVWDLFVVVSIRSYVCLSFFLSVILSV